MASTLGARVRALRERKGFSQAQLVEDVPLAPSYVSLIERDLRQPSEQVLSLIAAKLRCSTEYLRTGRQGPNADELELELRFAELALRSGDPQTARDRFADVVARAGELQHTDIQHDGSWGLCRAEKALGNLEAAIEGLELLSKESRLEGTFSRAALAMTLAHAHLECGETARAIEVAEAALATCEGDGTDPDEITELAATLSACYYERGDRSRAQLLIRRVVAAAEEGRSPRARAAAYWNAGAIAEGRGDLRAARAYTERALAIYSESDNLAATAGLRLNCAWLILRSPEPDTEAARVLLERAVSDLNEVGRITDVACAETELARCHLLAGDTTTAVTVARHAVDRLGPAPRLEAAVAWCVIGHANLADGEMRGAADAFTAAAGALNDAGVSRRAATTWRDIAEGLLAVGRVADAFDAYRRTADAARIPPGTVAVPGASAAAGPRRQQTS